MTPERWRQVTEVFHFALARDAADRASYLDQACAIDRALREEVEAMLVAHAAPIDTSFTRTPRLSPGTMIGPYRVADLIGAGGMGEVYRARDTKLGRDVAVKVLPTEFTADPDRLARFDREARILAALNHPYIAAIYGFEEAAGVRALVLELVEGETLADRLSGGPIPMDQALSIARQLADALEAAHEKGIIHRDLKPANITITPDGTVKVLDFGLAKAWTAEGVASDLSALPTLTVTTVHRAVMGTAAYMSPEQAHGTAVDKRTDIWAFGCVLYEMLTGRPAFAGDDVSETLARVLMKEPDWNALPPTTPPALRRLLRRCLAKDRRERLTDAADARLEIVETLTAHSGDAVPSSTWVPQMPLWRRAVAPIFTLMMGGLIVGFGAWLFTRPPPPRVTRLTVAPSGSIALNVNGFDPDVAISPDGARLAYVGTAPQQIVVRALDRLEPTTLDGLGSPGGLFFSFDGQWLGFFDGFNALNKVPITGGRPVTVSRIIGNPAGASWGTDDTIVFATGDSSGLLRVSAAGGEPEVLTTPNRDQGEVDHVWPEILPRAQAVLFTIVTVTGPHIAVVDLATRQQKILVRGASNARYVASGQLVYAVAGTLWAVAFDPRRLEVLGAPVPVPEQVTTAPAAATNVSIAVDGTLVYVPTAVAATRTLAWVDRQGREELINAPPRAYVYPRLSPDGTRVAVDTRDREGDIWIWDFARETLTRLTFHPRLDSHPVWTPDGQRVVFRSQRVTPGNLFSQAADGTGAVERLTESQASQFPGGFSADGTALIFREEVAGTGADLTLLTLSGARRTQAAGVGGPGQLSTTDVRSLVQTTFDELNGEISPDGRWVAYQSNESKQDEIYVRPFPDANRGRWQISTGGGTRPLWARDGNELFYLGPGGAVMRVAVQGGSTFRVGNQVRLFEGPYFTTPTQAGRTYDISRDGQRFLMIKVGDGSDQAATPPSIVVVQNWQEELKRLVPTR